MEFSDIQQLETSGVTVINLSHYSLSDYGTVSAILAEQQEFLDTTKPLSAGGFGAFGNPSSFHSETIRKLRSDLALYLLPTLRLYYSNSGRSVSALFDRFCIRYPGTSTSKEAWHRDSSPIQTGDTVLGGWYNLGSEPQYFSCILGSHIDYQYPEKSGFITISDKSEFASKRTIIRVPPQHQLLFNQCIIHEVIPIKSKSSSARLFTGYYISKNSEPLFGSDYLESVFTTQSNPLLPSGQQVPFYPKLWAVNWKPRLQQYSDNIKPVFKTGGGIVTRFSISLLSASELDPSIKLFSPYTNLEKSIYYPNKLI